MAVGIYFSRRDQSQQSEEGLLLAGRQLSWVVGAFTLTATWVGGGYINATAEAVYDPNLGLVWCQAPWCFALSLILGGLFFAGPMRRAGYTTMLDPFAERYGRRFAALLFVPALLGELFWSAAILAALGMTFSAVLGFDISTSILISSAVAVGYTVVGGLWSVVCTDVLQLFCILLGLSIAIPYAAEHVGGIEAAVTNYFATRAGRAPFPDHAIWSWMDFALMLTLGGLPWQVYFQRVLACRDDRVASRLSYIAGVGCFLMAIPAVLIGMIGAGVDWQTVGVPPPESPSMILPYLLRYLTTPMIATIALGAVAAAVMSSVDSSILSAATMFSWNVYRSLIRPQASDEEIKKVMRASIVVVGVIATALALSVQSVYVLWALCADLVYVILFPQLTTVLFFGKVNRRAAAVGIGIALILRIGGGEPGLGFPAFIPYPWEGSFPYRTTAMLANLGITWAGSRWVARKLATPSPSE